MREVSCRALSGYREYAVRRGVDWQQLIAGLSTSPEHLSDDREWFDWADFAEILKRLEQACGAGACREAGRSGVNADTTAPLRRVAGASIDVHHLYRFGVVWMIPLLLRHVRGELDVVHRGHLRVRFSIPDHYAENTYFFHGVHGGLEALPSIVGLPWADVTADIGPRGADYDIRLPFYRRSLLERVRLLFGGPAVKELERQVQAISDMERERFRVERELRERDRMLSNLLENLSGLVYRCRAQDFTFEYASPQSIPLIGHGPSELVGGAKSLLSFIHPEDRGRVREERERALAEGQPCTTEYRMRHANGEMRWVLDVSRGIREHERIVTVEGFITDITEQKRLEEDLDQAQRAESVGRLAGGVAHDFNNLLTVIIGLVELSRGELPEQHPVHDHIEQIGVTADRAAGLTRQLLAFARRQPIAPRLVNLNALADGMQKMLERTLMEDVALERVSGQGLWSVRVDPGQFEQVLLNLAINARDAMPDGGALTIETGNIVLETVSRRLPGMPPGEYVLLRVTDSGLGMDGATRLRAFEPFFTTKETGRGTGLGLASTQGIVSQAGGYIFLDTAPGNGSEFSIYLPRAQGVAVTTTAERPEPGRGHGEQVLLVEDHASLLSLFGDALEAGGYRVLRASSGAEAIRLAREHAPIDALVTDVVLPEMGGLALSSQLRARFPRLPVLFMSGYSERGRLDDDGTEGPTAFLAKPFTPAVLAGGVRQLLDRARVPRLRSAPPDVDNPGTRYN